MDNMDNEKRLQLEVESLTEELKQKSIEYDQKSIEYDSVKTALTKTRVRVRQLQELGRSDVKAEEYGRQLAVWAHQAGQLGPLSPATIQEMEKYSNETYLKNVCKCPLNEEDEVEDEVEDEEVEEPWPDLQDMIRKIIEKARLKYNIAQRRKTAEEKGGEEKADAESGSMDVKIATICALLISTVNPKARWDLGWLGSMWIYGKTHSALVTDLFAAIFPGAKSYSALRHSILDSIEGQSVVANNLHKLCIVSWNNASSNYKLKFSREYAQKAYRSNVFTSVSSISFTETEDNWDWETFDIDEIQQDQTLGPGRFLEQIKEAKIENIMNSAEQTLTLQSNLEMALEKSIVVEMTSGMTSECTNTDLRIREPEGAKARLTLLKSGKIDKVQEKICAACSTINGKGVKTCRACAMGMPTIAMYRLAMASSGSISDRRNFATEFGKSMKKVKKDVLETLFSGNALDNEEVAHDVRQSTLGRDEHLSKIGITKKCFERQCLPAILLNPNSTDTIRIILHDILHSHQVREFLLPYGDNNEQEHLPCLKEWLFGTADLGASSVALLVNPVEDDTKFRRRVWPIMGLFHCYATYHRMIFVLAWISGASYFAPTHYGVMSTKAVKWLKHATDLHKSNDFLMYVALPAFQKAFFEEFIEHVKANETDWFNANILQFDKEKQNELNQVEVILDHFSSWLNEDSNDNTFKNQRGIWFKFVPMLLIFKKAIRNDNLDVADSAMSYLLPLLWTRGHNQYGPEVIRDLVRYRHAAPNAIKLGRKYCALIDGSPVDERHEEMNRQLKIAGMLNSEAGILFTSSMLDTIMAITKILSQQAKCPNINPDLRDRVEYDLTRSVKDMTKCIFDLSYVKKGGPNGDRTDNVTPNGTKLSSTVDELYDKGITRVEQAIVPICNNQVFTFPKKVPLSKDDCTYTADLKNLVLTQNEPDSGSIIIMQGELSLEEMQDNAEEEIEQRAGEIEPVQEPVRENNINDDGKESIDVECKDGSERDFQCFFCEHWYSDEIQWDWLGCEVGNDDNACGNVWSCNKAKCLYDLKLHELGHKQEEMKKDKRKRKAMK